MSENPLNTALVDQLSEIRTHRAMYRCLYRRPFGCFSQQLDEFVRLRALEAIGCLRRLGVDVVGPQELAAGYRPRRLASLYVGCALVLRLGVRAP